jgi:hypothetical protein
MHRFLIFGAALIGLMSSVSAQQKQSMTVQKANTSPIFAGVFHPATGLNSSSGNTPKVGPVTLYNNNNYSNYYSLPGKDQEWVDNGRLLDRNHDSLEQFGSFDFTYCSTSSNANGVTTTIRFYDESVYCAGPVNWPTSDCAYQFNNLPGGTNGNLACWFVLVDLAGVECNLTSDPAGNQRFGWSHTWGDNFSGSWIAEGGLGQTSSWTWWDRNASNANSGYQGCYWFGWPPWNGFAMAAQGNYAETSNVDCPPGIDDSLWLSINDEVQVGKTVSWTVTGQSAGATTHFWASPDVVCNDLNTAFGIDAHEIARYGSRVFQNDALGSHTFTIPPTAGGGLTWYTQAATRSAGLPTAMSNGLQHYVF